MHDNLRPLKPPFFLFRAMVRTPPASAQKGKCPKLSRENVTGDRSSISTFRRLRFNAFYPLPDKPPGRKRRERRRKIINGTSGPGSPLGFEATEDSFASTSPAYGPGTSTLARGASSEMLRASPMQHVSASQWQGAPAHESLPSAAQPSPIVFPQFSSPARHATSPARYGTVSAAALSQIVSRAATPVGRLQRVGSL